MKQKNYFFLTPILLSLCAYTYFIQFNAYGFFHFESLALLSICLIFSSLLGLAIIYSNWTLKIILLSVSTTVYLSFLPGFQNDLTIKIIFFSLVGLSVFFLDTIPKLVCIMGIIFLLSELLFPVGTQFVGGREYIATSSPARNLPPIIHIVFDEHVGIGALPLSSNSVQLKKELNKFYTQAGFTVYDNAFSHYVRTYNSISNLLNFIPQDKNAAYFPEKTRNLSLRHNEAFRLLSKKGYQIHVYQSSYLNFCKANDADITYCYTYPTHDINAIKNLSLSPKERTIYLTKSFLLISSAYQKFIIFYEYYLRPSLAWLNMSIPHLRWAQDEISTVPAMSIWEKLAKDVLAHPQGNVFFVHLLAPHSPYIYDNSCQVIPDVDKWYINYDMGPEGNISSRRQWRYQFYENQLSCLYLKINKFFSNLKQQGLYDQATIVMNGDHSARIIQVVPLINSANQLSWQDFQDSYATLFAVKFPNTKGQVEYQRLPITYLYGKTFEKLTGYSVPLDKASPYVYLTVDDPNADILMPHYPLSAFKNSPLR